MLFSVLIATLDRPDELRGTLQSLAACDPAPDEVIVIDATGRLIEPGVERVWGPGSPVRLLLGRGQGTFTRFGYPRYIRDGFTPQDVEYMPGCFMSARRQIARD